MGKFLFTSESVTEGHPDKICDQISDAVLDAILENDPQARVACETTVTTGLISIMGEISTHCYVDIPKIARGVVREIGYDPYMMIYDKQHANKEYLKMQRWCNNRFLYRSCDFFDYVPRSDGKTIRELYPEIINNL